MKSLIAKPILGIAILIGWLFGGILAVLKRALKRNKLATAGAVSGGVFGGSTGIALLGTAIPGTAVFFILGGLSGYFLSRRRAFTNLKSKD